MRLANILDQAADRLEQVNWKQLTKDVIKAWDNFFKIIVITLILTYLACKLGENLVYRLNDILAANWVRLIVPPTPAEGQALIVVEEVDTPLTAAEVEQPLPPALVIPDPWESPIEVELMLPLALKPMAMIFATPPMLVAVQAPVALLAAGQAVTQQTPPPATNGRRKRGRRAHQNRTRQIF